MHGGVGAGAGPSGQSPATRFEAFSQVIRLNIANKQAAAALPVDQIQFRVVADTAMHVQNRVKSACA